MRVRVRVRVRLRVRVRVRVRLRVRVRVDGPSCLTAEKCSLTYLVRGRVRVGSGLALGLE